MRLIDADALKAELEKQVKENNKVHKVVIDNDFETMIHDAPTIDAVEVVRCKDCKHWDMWENGTGICQRSKNSYFWVGVDFDDYCSFGERSEE